MHETIELIFSGSDLINEWSYSASQPPVPFTACSPEIPNEVEHWSSQMALVDVVST
jgi:hypothetical protein